MVLKSECSRKYGLVSNSAVRNSSKGVCVYRCVDAEGLRRRPVEGSMMGNPNGVLLCRREQMRYFVADRCSTTRTAAQAPQRHAAPRLPGPAQLRRRGRWRDCPPRRRGPGGAPPFRHRHRPLHLRRPQSRRRLQRPPPRRRQKAGRRRERWRRQPPPSTGGSRPPRVPPRREALRRRRRRELRSREDRRPLLPQPAGRPTHSRPPCRRRASLLPS